MTKIQTIAKKNKNYKNVMYIYIDYITIKKGRLKIKQQRVSFPSLYSQQLMAFIIDVYCMND